MTEDPKQESLQTKLREKYRVEDGFTELVYSELRDASKLSPGTEVVICMVADEDIDMGHSRILEFKIIETKTLEWRDERVIFFIKCEEVYYLNSLGERKELRPDKIVFDPKHIFNTIGVGVEIPGTRLSVEGNSPLMFIRQPQDRYKDKYRKCHRRKLNLLLSTLS